MKLLILGGFLGSGKTSLILSLAHYLVERETGERNKLVIIENEIGEIGIDNKVLNSDGLTVKELFAGCMCCTLASDLITTLLEIAERINPRWVIFEPTGLAYPSRIIETITKYGKGIESITNVTVVDAERWNELSEIAPVLVHNQLKGCDFILVNKIDLVGADELKNIVEQVKEDNSDASLYQVSAQKEIDSSIWGKVAGYSA